MSPSTQFSFWLKFVTSFIFIISISVIFSSKSYAGFYSTSQDNFYKLPVSLPDDSGLYTTDSGNRAIYRCAGGSGTPLGENTPPQNRDICPGPQPMDDNDHHQYFTISSGPEINNEKNGEKIPGGGFSTTEIILYTLNPSNAQNLSFNIWPFNRAIRTNGNESDCSGNLSLTAFSRLGAQTINRTFQKECPSSSTEIRLRDFGVTEKNDFTQLTSKDKNGVEYRSAIWYIKVRIKLDSDPGQSLQFSYRVSSDAMRLGVAKDSFVNVYPTALGDRHRLRFKWKAPCYVPPAERGPINVYMDNLDGTRTRVQAHDPEPRIQSLSAGASLGWASIVGRDSYSTTFPSNSGDVSQSQELMLYNISGGNGVGFVYPFNSGDAFIDCPTPEPPALDNDTFLSPNPKKVKYEPPIKPSDRSPSIPEPPDYSMGVNCTTHRYNDRGTMRLYGPINKSRCETWNQYYKDRVIKAREAFAQASFNHSVGNIGGTIASNGTHQSRVQYRFMRANSPSTGQNGERDNYADRFGGMTWSSDLNPIEWKTAFITQPTTSAHGGSAGAAELINGDTNDYGRPWYGDMYCERIVTDPGNIRSYDGSNTEYCVQLFENPSLVPICSPMWNLYTNGFIQQKESGTWPSDDVNLGRTVDDAWVGNEYRFRYTAYKSGPASETDPIESNVGDINTQKISNINPEDPFAVTNGEYTIRPDQAGQVIRQQPYFQYTSNDPNRDPCLQGRDEFEMSVTVPYYYHSIPKTSGSVPSQVQQGETISVNGSIKNPSDDRDSELMPGDNENGGRGHTYTENIGWQRVIFRANDIADVNSKFTANGMRQGSGSGVCEVLGGIGIGGYRDCSVRDSGNTTLQIEEKDLGLPGITLGLEPVGTVVCVALGINDPTHSTSPSDWRIAQPKCTTIIKSPKVQFKYGDVAVGRERLGVSPTCTVNPTAKIQATSAPNVSLVSVDDTEKYKFGSWGEYGVFSSGSILSFGSSGAEAGTTDKAKRLSFGNTSSTYGNYPYGIKCLPNLMNGYSAENTIPADTIYPNQYFTDPSRNTKSRFQRTGNINLTLEPTKTYQAILSLRGYSDCGNDVPNGPLTPAKVRFVVELVGGQKITSSDMEVSSCSESSRPTYQTTVQLGGDGWRGIKRVDLQFINNNHNAAWETNSSQMRDRNLFVESLKIQWVRNGSEEIATTPLMSAADSRVSRTHPDDYYSTAPGNIDSDALCRKTNTDGRWWIGGSAFPDGRVAVPSTLGDLGYLSGLCHGLHIDNLASSTDGRFDDSETPTPILGPSYDGFRGRNIILYAKDTDNNCANNNGGNININLDMDYKRDGYTKLSEIPRFTLMADCNIIINNTVKEVRASLIAGDAIMTCSSRARTQGECNSKLTVTGAIQAKRLLLWRTSGADLTNPTDARVPAETFVYGVDQMMAGYEYGLTNPVLKPSYQRDLPPRY
jgi:hypothetical protein